VPLPRTAEDARANHDPRPALTELYRDHADYVAKVTKAARALQEERLLLPEDVDLVIREAQESNVLR
jgi:hypothetical protein